MSVLNSIRDLLTSACVTFREVTHEPTFTSEQSAQARGEPLSAGAKALVVKADEQFRLLVLPADRKLDSAAVKREFQVKKLRFATPDELMELTGLVPGSVPPFGQPILPLDLWADEAVGQSGNVAFNAGSLTSSIVMRGEDWLRAAQPRRIKLASS